MKPIPLIHAEHAVRIADLLDAEGIPADRYLERARLSPGIREEASGFLPGRSIWALAGAVEEGEGLGDFWLDLARGGRWRRAGWIRPLTHAVTLGDALRALCRSYVRQIPMNRLGLTAEGPVVWFWRRRIPDVHDWPGSEPAEQYTLSFMLEVIRAAAGPEWLPEQLKLESPASGWAARTSRLAGVRIQYDEPGLAVALPAPLLSLPVSITALPAARPEGEPPEPDFQGSLRQLLKSWMDGGPGLPSQEIAAELLWTSRRSLCRRLADEDTSWSKVVGDLRFARAVQRLEAGVPVREIAEELGYSDAAHFSRFFRARAGVSPRAYREQVERARELAGRA
jgi:AraC-like DNA-binding protein